MEQSDEEKDADLLVDWRGRSKVALSKKIKQAKVDFIEDVVLLDSDSESEVHVAQSTCSQKTHKSASLDFLETKCRSQCNVVTLANNDKIPVLQDDGLSVMHSSRLRSKNPLAAKICVRTEFDNDACRNEGGMDCLKDDSEGFCVQLEQLGSCLSWAVMRNCDGERRSSLNEAQGIQKVVRLGTVSPEGGPECSMQERNVSRRLQDAIPSSLLIQKERLASSNSRSIISLSDDDDCMELSGISSTVATTKRHDISVAVERETPRSSLNSDGDDCMELLGKSSQRETKKIFDVAEPIKAAKVCTANIYEVEGPTDDNEWASDILNRYGSGDKRTRDSGAFIVKEPLASTVSNPTFSPRLSISSDDDMPRVDPKERCTSSGRGARSPEKREARRIEKLKERELKKLAKEEEKRQRHAENLQKKQDLKQQKQAAKDQAAERRRTEQESSKWKKGKFALKHTTAIIDNYVFKMKFTGHHLLRQLDEKNYQYEIRTNPIEKSIIWKMRQPSARSHGDPQDLENEDDRMNKTQTGLSPHLGAVDIKYVAIILEGEEFTDMVINNTLDAHVRNVQKQHQGFRICYVINKLLAFLKKRNRPQYNDNEVWTTVENVEKVLAELVTNYSGVQSRHCQDEAEVADHIVGLMRGLAQCPFKPPLTSLTLNANGEHIAKGDPNRQIVKKSLWLRALVAIPKVSGAMAIAIGEKYPTMRSLLDCYRDASITVHEKEQLLENLSKTSSTGNEGRIGRACSIRVYRILMAQNSSLRTEDVELGADMFNDGDR